MKHSTKFIKHAASFFFFFGHGISAYENVVMNLQDSTYFMFISRINNYSAVKANLYFQ